MKYKVIAICLGVMMIASTVSAQQVGRGDSSRSGELEVINTNVDATANNTVASELVQELLLDDFEKAGEWSSFMPRDYGVTRAMRREGAPRKYETQADCEYVLGVKTEFMKRAWSWVSVVPAKPIKIKGLTRKISVWVIGRSYRHTLSFVIRDYLNHVKFLTAEQTLWHGWKQVNVNMPDTIKQHDYKISEERGITFLGFRIDFEPRDMLGRPFYIYFDYLTAMVDIFTEENQNPDDMLDHW